jgi:hypothetical protein
MRSRPPVGSKPIDQTEWSGDHRVIKEHLGLTPIDRVYIDRNANVWVQSLDGTWSDHGPAVDYTTSGAASGRRGRDKRR